MRSISPRWLSEKDCARAGSDANPRMAAESAIRTGRSRRGIEVFLSIPAGTSRRLVRYDIVRANPTGRSGWKAGFRPRRKVARRFEIAASERGLGGGQIGFRKIPLLAVRHR